MPADKLQITLAGREHVVEAGTTAGQALEGAGGLATISRNAAPGAGDVIAARVNGELRDLACPLADGDVVEPVELGSDAGLAIMRHSAAHVMAQAVQDINPGAKLGIGPPIENGFYYDFDVASPFEPDDLKNIEQRMRQIVKQGQLFSRRVVTDAEARAELAGEPYKLELIGLKGGGAIDAEESVEVGGRGTDHLRQPRPGHRRAEVEGPVPRPAPADHPAHPGAEGDAQRRRVLAGEREEPAAAADLRHRLAVPRRAGRVPGHAGRGRAARPPQARRRAGPVLVPDRDRQRAAGVPPQGRDHPAGARGLLAAAARGRRV